ncbi:MAG: NfeD family protein [Oscillospiraceae bacterium]|nr:NfeD family protein [Oscillospiraceae bacterium]
MEFFLQNLWAMWIVVGIFFLVIELCTTALISIWFVPAAGITALLSLIIPKVSWQIAIFALLSAVFMILFKKLYKSKIKKTEDDVKPETSLIGKSGVTQEPTGVHGGRVKCGDVYWRAVSEDGNIIDAGETVIITSVNDTTLVVKKVNSD